MSIGELKRKSKADMKNNYGFAILTMILLNLVLFGAMTLGLFIGMVLVLGAVRCCFAAFYVDVANHTRQGVDSTYRGFRQFARALWAGVIMFLIALAILLVMAIVSVIILGASHADFSATAPVMLICAIIGIVIIFLIFVRLSFVFYIMNHEVDLSAVQCIRRSWALSKGMFFKIVLLNLSFIGWWLLVAITLGAMYLYVGPYYETTRANLYLSAAGAVGNK